MGRVLIGEKLHY